MEGERSKEQLNKYWFYSANVRTIGFQQLLDYYR